jgi:hypothetical protein
MGLELPASSLPYIAGSITKFSLKEKLIPNHCPICNRKTDNLHFHHWLYEDTPEAIYKNYYCRLCKVCNVLLGKIFKGHYPNRIEDQIKELHRYYSEIPKLEKHSKILEIEVLAFKEADPIIPYPKDTKIRRCIVWGLGKEYLIDTTSVQLARWLISKKIKEETHRPEPIRVLSNLLKVKSLYIINKQEIKTPQVINPGE